MKDALTAAVEAYEFGVMPGDESEATDDEIRTMAQRVLDAVTGPSLGLERLVRLGDVVDALRGLKLRSRSVRASGEYFADHVVWCFIEAEEGDQEAAGGQFGADPTSGQG